MERGATTKREAKQPEATSEPGPQDVAKTTKREANRSRHTGRKGEANSQTRTANPAQDVAKNHKARSEQPEANSKPGTRTY
jgi:hypothetical protein